MVSMQGARLPAFANPFAGGADAAIKALRSDARIDLHITPPDELQSAVKEILQQNPATIVVAGGDGTVSSAASAVIGTQTALSILRAGTLNHFARRIGVPADPRKALDLAFTGNTTRVDVGLVNDHVFLNTCVVGLYVIFVKRREQLQPKIGYVASSLVAGMQTFADFRSHRMDVEIGGRECTYTSAILFVGVGERDFKIPLVGEPLDSGERGLHIVVAKPLSRAQLALMLVRAPVRGIQPWPTDDSVDSFIVDRFHATLHRSTEKIALDGEIVEFAGRLSFRSDPSALAVCVPEPC